MKKRIVVLVLLAVVVLPIVALAVRGFGNGAGWEGASPGSGNIGLIDIEGEITGGHSGTGILNGSSTAGGDDLMQQLAKARQDPSIKAVLIRINSPGGSPTASQEIGDEIDLIKKSGKKVVVSMGDVAASGGYWIAAKADKIVANSTSLTGSIGVIMSTQNLQGLYNKLGIQQGAIKSAPYKDIGSPNRPMTPEEVRILQGMIDDIYNQFIDVVAAGRHLDRQRVKQLADGRVFTGRQAKAVGLVDELGNFNYAVRYTGKLAGIKGTPGIKDFGASNPFAFLTTGSRLGFHLPGTEDSLSATQAVQQLKDLLLLKDGGLQ